MESRGAVSYKGKVWVGIPEEGKGRLDELELLLPFHKLILFTEKLLGNDGYSHLYTKASGFTTFLPSRLGDLH